MKTKYTILDRDGHELTDITLKNSTWCKFMDSSNECYYVYNNNQEYFVYRSGNMLQGVEPTKEMLKHITLS